MEEGVVELMMEVELMVVVELVVVEVVAFKGTVS